MQVEIVCCNPDGTERNFGMRKLDHMPPVDEPFTVENSQFVVKGYSGPDHQGCYRLLLESEAGNHKH
jgi:hypothetical protein